jgi:hypothetical protein
VHEVGNRKPPPGIRVIEAWRYLTSSP